LLWIILGFLFLLLVNIFVLSRCVLVCFWDVKLLSVCCVLGFGIRYGDKTIKCS
jgi:hypothetical protein